MQNENKIEQLFANARNEKPGMELDEVLQKIALTPAAITAGNTTLNSGRMRWIIASCVVVVTAIFSLSYFITPDKPAENKIVPVIKTKPAPVIKMTNEAPQKEIPVKTKIVSTPQKKRVDIIGKLKKHELITIDDTEGKFILYFKNNELVGMHLNDSTIEQQNWKDYASIIDKAIELKKSNTESNKNQ
jgi:hypothetical protein